jgi:hypothetical protein
MGQRSLTRIYDATSAAAGSIDSGAVDTEDYTALIVAVVASGAAAPASAAASAVLDSVPTYASLGTVALPAIGAGLVTVLAEPPVKTRFQATGGAGSTVRLVVYGVRE